MSRFSSSSSLRTSSSSSYRKKSSTVEDSKQNIADIFGVNLKAFKRPQRATSGQNKDTALATNLKTVEKVNVDVKKSTSSTQAKNNLSNNFNLQRLLKSTRVNIDLEKIPDFAIARPRILPVLKPENWQKTTQDMLKKIDPKKDLDVLFFPVVTLPNSSLGYTLAIVNEEGSMQYILRNYLQDWNISEKVLKDVAIRNLEHRLENRGARLWKRSKAGVYYLDNLGAVSASVVLLPQFLDGLDIEEGDPVIVIPSGDMCLVGGAKSDTQLCIMGEIALQFTRDQQYFGIKPFRFSKNRFMEYSPKMYAQEQNVPQSVDEVRSIKLRLKPLKISREK